jgi:hypothetical protein
LQSCFSTLPLTLTPSPLVVLVAFTSQAANKVVVAKE